jgi:hypothetical protein
MNKKAITNKLDEIGWAWRDGVSTKQDTGDRWSAKSYQIIKKDSPLRVKYLYSLKELTEFVSGERHG